MSLTLFTENLESIPSVAKQILDYALPHKKFVFYAEMGVGKTTLIKELSLQLGVTDVVSSPTFSIVNEYLTKEDGSIYHFDFYRVEDSEEILELGIEDAFSEGISLIEWPDRMDTYIPAVRLDILLSNCLNF